MDTGKKATPSPPDATPTPTRTASTPVSYATSVAAPTIAHIKTDPAPPPMSTPTPFQPNASPCTPGDASPELKIIIDPKEEDLKEEVKEEEEDDMEVETEKPVVAVEALPPATLPSLTSVGGLALASGFPLPPLMEKQRAIVKPQILTHFIDGFYIHEGPEPFPVSNRVFFRGDGSARWLDRARV